jgi:hypothetical protein
MWPAPPPAGPMIRAQFEFHAKPNDQNRRPSHNDIGRHGHNPNCHSRRLAKRMDPTKSSGRNMKTYFCSRCAYPSDKPLPTELCEWCIKELANWPQAENYTCPHCGRTTDSPLRRCPICNSLQEDSY